jgi:hypothetical protein
MELHAPVALHPGTHSICETQSLSEHGIQAEANNIFTQLRVPFMKNVAGISKRILS